MADETTGKTADALAGAVRDVLAGIAPEAADAGFDPRAPFRDQFDFDSMDQLNFAIALERRFGVGVEAADYPLLSSLDACLDWLARHGTGSGPATSETRS